MTRRGLVPKTDAFFFLRFGFVSQTVSVAAASEILTRSPNKFPWLNHMPQPAQDQPMVGVVVIEDGCLRSLVRMVGRHLHDELRVSSRLARGCSPS